MKKLNVEELRGVLKNREFDFVELDNLMEENGYYSVFDDGVTADIKKDKSVVYTGTDTNEAEVKIDFCITINNGEDEIEEAFCLKVEEVEKF